MPLEMAATDPYTVGLAQIPTPTRADASKCPAWVKAIMRRLVNLILIVCVVSVAAYAQATGSVRGNVVDVRGDSTAWMYITVRNTETGREYHQSADQKGAFAFEGLEPGRYVIITSRPGIERILREVNIEPGKTAQVELVGYPQAPASGTDDMDKFIASSEAQGGRYPAGNISYLNVNDTLDFYLMAAYFAILALLSVYGIYRYRLVYLFLRYRNHRPQPKSRFAANLLPRITVQLPLFNEMYVAERIIDSVTKLDYPRELLEIQVLDDSNDETCEIAERAVKKYFDQGFDISYHHRKNREGFKAGALEEGLKKSSGELVLIFDADFAPRPDCIRRMVDYFTDDRIGMVQMRWSHINADYSLLTKVQAIMLDGHLVIEQTSRHRSGGFFNFNGTAGMWRREAIEWSGGWQHDTLTEDTDLSYRAQLMGWRFVYLLDDDVPAELPVDINAFKSQQRRWAKGVVQVGLKLMGRMWRDPRLSLQAKLEQFFRLTGNLAAPLVIILALINLPIIIVRYNQGLFHLFVLDVPILTFSTFSVLAYYVVPQWYLNRKSWWRTLKYMPFVMSMGIALTFSNARAVIEALMGVKSPFVRTPKYRIEDTGDTTWMKKRYVRRRLSVPVLELLFALYFIFTIWYAIDSRIFGTLPFLFIYFFGYAYAAVMTIAQGRIRVRRK
jgi:cellulose synthase/poly-beta-1,6-N-acetylglucosamine synthase-like glycosyltransferase